MLFIPVRSIEKGSASWWRARAEERGMIPVVPAKKFGGRLSKVKYLWLDPNKISRILECRNGTQIIEYDDDDRFLKIFSIPQPPETAVEVEELLFAEDRYHQAVWHPETGVIVR